MIRPFVAALIGMMLACGHDTSARSDTMRVTDESYVRKVLTTWLVNRDLDATREFLAPDFFISKSDGGNAEHDRMLGFPATCEGAPARCNSLDDCLRSSERGRKGFDMKTITVGPRNVKLMPGLRSREGRKVIVVTFVLKGCNLATMLFIDAEARDDHRIVTVDYFAG